MRLFSLDVGLADATTQVVERSREWRRVTRESRVREYFYGATGDLSPHQKVLNFDEVQIFRIGGGTHGL
jgi:polyribonucleotide 5'-hydroxyl-kinase